MIPAFVAGLFQPVLQAGKRAELSGPTKVKSVTRARHEVVARMSSLATVFIGGSLSVCLYLSQSLNSVADSVLFSTGILSRGDSRGKVLV